LGRIVVATDVFGTKPLWIGSFRGSFGIASYGSALRVLGITDPRKVDANSINIYNLDLKLTDQYSVFDFDLRQHKNSFDDWTAAFKQAIKKRCLGSKQDIFIGLSSGYDSGAIACELNLLGIPYYAYSTVGRENERILRARHDLIPKNSKGFLFLPNEQDRAKAQEVLDNRVEGFNYIIYTSGSSCDERKLSVHTDQGAVGLSFICSKASEDRRRIYLSGQGADEIFADYGFRGQKKYPHSNFGGLFPDNLSSTFPWPSFYGGSQLSYLVKEEYISGAYGLEGRYPFLDRQVVQEFLSLDVRLKNSNYKSVLYNYLTEHGYPFDLDVKVGFCLSVVKRPIRKRVKIFLSGLIN
jgi:asparagine synthetase B (glutamine-hydrolysing)